jgi:hypothetical protein
MHLRLHQPASGTRLIVDTSSRKVYGYATEAALQADGLAAACEYAEYFVRAIPGTCTPDGRFTVRGGLTRAEAAALAAGGEVPAERTALELHLDFFDEDGDGRITLPENYRGWRALGFSRFAAGAKALFSALVFGGYAIDIERIANRRYAASGVFRRDGGIDEARLAPYLAEFDDAGGELSCAQVLAALERNSDPGMVSRRQFRSLFAVCRRMNAGRSVVTKAQFTGLFDGSLLWQAASLPNNAGRRARSLLMADPMKGMP